MEQYQEKLKLKDLQEIIQQSEQEKQASTNRTYKLNKKIRKRHHRKKGKISTNNNQNSSLIDNLLTKIPFYFDHNQEEVIDNLLSKFKSSVQIKNIISKQVITCYSQKNQNYQQQLKTYNELVKTAQISGPIQTIGLLSLKNSSKLGLKFIKELKSLGQAKVNSNNRRFLGVNEETMLIRRQQLMSQIVLFIYGYAEDKGYNIAKIPEELVQIMALCKLNAQTERQLVNKIQMIVERDDHLFNCHLELDRRQLNNLQNRYISALAIKNLQRSFCESPIDFFNYHKKNEYYEDNDFIQTPFDRLVSLSQFRKYAQNKKPKNHKSNNYLLRTPCSACFSQFSESYNPIINCPECHMRIHRCCQRVQNRCHRCRYGRTSNLQKKQSSYCFICNRTREKGMMILTVTNRSPHQFAHHYCLLLHKFWKVQKQEFVGQYIKEKLENKKCIYCENSQGYFFNSTCCGAVLHGMCAYLQGCSFRMNKEGEDYRVEIKCCGDVELKRRLNHERKFKMNYEKVVFREDKELFQYIENHSNIDSPEN